MENKMKITAIILSGLVAFSALTTSSQSAKAHNDAGAIVAGSILLGLGIAAIASERRRERSWRRHHRSHFHGHYPYGYYGFEPDFEPQYHYPYDRHRRHR